ncbi:NlpC/P60 family protein [Nocardia rhamnosiphila]|uniref:NlpC/P60 family protein n=1 Tax=Nocardia rhamnosiphila TaxID=426716 RepID=A0ABV2X1R1_9NOCA
MAAGLLAAALYGGGPAGADPAPAPTSASEAVQQMIDLSRQAEQLNQQALTAQADLDAKLAVQRDADAKVAAAGAAVDAARNEVARYRPMIDRTAIAAYQGARTNRLFSVLVSDSPQQLLDQMSTLDVVATQTSDQLKQYKRATDAATAAQSAARAAADTARAATDQANTVRDDVGRKQTDLQNAVARVIEVWGGLSTADRTALAGSPFPPGFDRDSLLRDLVPGSGTSALAAGLTRVGDPYVWGATGPDQFDCSGLVQWAFRQVGKEVPRTSSAQAAYGTPVGRDELQPGDVVFFYDDISHVGIYAGNGLMLHASTFGVPVAVAPMDSTPYHSARRY